MTNQKMMIVVEIEIPRQTIEDVFVNALEGGSNYWYWLPDEAVDKIRAAVPSSVEPVLSVAMSMAILDHGVEVPIHDVENEDDCLGVISIKTLRNRLQLLASNMDYKWAFDEVMRDGGDASSCDVWMQYMSFGEVIFG